MECIENESMRQDLKTIRLSISRMHVLKRDGELQAVNFNKITKRLSDLAICISTEIDPIKIGKKVCNSIYDKVTTRELDELSAEIAIGLCTEHPDYGTLAAHICVSNLHKYTPPTFSQCVKELFEARVITQKLYNTVVANETRINSAIDTFKDYSFDFFGLKTLIKSYLFKVGDKIVERPQYMLMRVALSIHHSNIDDAIETYALMSDKYFIHATPTLFNAGTEFPQLSSCYLVELQEDSISGIFDTLKDCATISKWAGGIGLNIHKLRSTGSDVRNNKNACTGIVPSLRVFNATSRYVNQGGKRPGSIAIYLTVDHPDIMSLLELKKNHGDEEQRCRDLFYGIWVSDLFMRRVRDDLTWSLFCPHALPSPLEEVYGEKYDEMYLMYESQHLYKKQMKARDLWSAICNSQIETGTPYVLYKDAINRKSNQKNVGTIKSSNLCCEIVEYTSPDEIAVCNLASIGLPVFVKDGKFDHALLHKVVKVMTRNLNKVIDINMYPVEKARVSNLRHRPIGIGIQGLADVFIMLGQPFDSKQAATTNMDIFETIYHASLEASMELAKINTPYDTFSGSPVSKGILQFDMWDKHEYCCGSGRYDWNVLRTNIMKNGLRNSLLVAPMPTASTSQILGNNECFEPYTSNLYLRRTSAGEFVVVNKHLVKDLLAIGLWNTKMKELIISHNGSVQNIQSVPSSIKELYKTAWEISQKALINLSADRGIYVCQSQSLNLFMQRPSIKSMSSMHFYGWERGLKTGIYYLRTQAAAQPIQFTIEPGTCESCSA
jgi:ribonucleoside-diphosphate reductase alpha chain